MERQIKTHPMEIHKEILAWFFTEAEKHLLEVELVEVVGSNKLLVDVIYEPNQRIEMMMLIEGVDRWNWNRQQIEMDKNESKSDRP